MPDGPTIRDLCMLLLGSGIGAISNHYLGRDSARTDRLRSARAKVRGWIERIEGAHPGYLFQDQEAISGEIAEMRNRLVDDIRFWNRRGFLLACSEFINAKEEDSRPVVRPFANQLSKEEQEKEKQEWLRPGKVMKSRLESIMKRI